MRLLFGVTVLWTSLLAFRGNSAPGGSAETPGDWGAWAAAAESGRAVSGAGAGRAAVVRPFTWRDVERPEYTNYLAALRAAGCPEEHIRHIVASDVTGYFDQQRLREAIEWDYEWWKPVPTARLYPPAAIGAEARLESLRADLFSRSLGTNWAADLKVPAIRSGLTYHLTGAVLGAMPLERFSAVVEVCRRSEERMRDYQLARFGQGEPIDPVEETRQRQQTRSELGELMTPAEMEEFLVRNSQNAETLRLTLQAFGPSREEFLKIFRVLDPIQFRMQAQYGSPAALSARQRDEYQRQCLQAVREVLTPARYRDYLATVDVHYRRARAAAAKHGLNDAGLTRLYDFYRAQAGRRDALLQDSSLSVEQKNRAGLELLREEEDLLAKLAEAKQR